MKIIDIYNVKGGCGKSSISFFAGKFLASQGKKTLLIDLDPQRSLSKSFGEIDGNNIYDVLYEECSLEDAIRNIGDNLFLVQGSIKTLKIQNNINKDLFESKVRNLKGYDFIVMDNAPSYNELITAGIYASDIVIVPALISFFDLEEVEFVIKEIEKIKKQTIKIVLNRVHSLGKYSADEMDYLKMFQNAFGKYLAKNRIPNSLLVRRFIDRGENLTGKSEMKKKFMKNLMELMQEITEVNFQQELFI